MADPTSYNRTYSFTDFQSGNPSKPLPGVQVDNELENVELSLNEAIDAIKDVRRSDGALKNEIVTLDSLDPTVKAGVGAGALASAAAAAASADAASDSAVAAAASATAADTSKTAGSGYASTALTYRNEAGTERTLAQTARTGAQAARDHAAAWASAAEGVDVDDGVNPVSKSSYHWAQVALGAATGALPDNSVSTTKIVDGAATTDKLADSAVTEPKLAANLIAGIAADRTALRAIDTSRYSVVYLKETGREGVFLFKAGDYSAKVTADAAEGVYIKANGVAASAGAWVRVVEGDINVRWFGVDGTASGDTAAANAAIALFGDAYFPKGEYAITAGGVDLRRLRGPGILNLTSGTRLMADALPDRGPMAQRYTIEVKNPTNNSTTQSIAVHNGKLYRSQENTVAGNSFAYDTTVDITELDLPAGDGRSRATIDYTSDTGSQLPNYTVTVKGLGHGDGIALLTEGGQTWMYGHCSAPPGSSDPAAEATGYVKFPWLGAATALEPAGAVFYRNLQGVGNPNFGMSSDGKWLLFIQRDVYVNGALTQGNGSVTTYRCVVHDRAKIEAAGPANAHTVPPFAKFVVLPHELSDTLYAQAGITSDGKYIYITFSGARVVGKTFLHIYTMSGDFVKAIITSGIRAEDVSVYSNGKSGWLPAFYETEGLTMHGDKLLTSSRYLFTSGSPVVSWRGHNYVYIGTNPSSGNYPNRVDFWAPTKAAATHGAYNPATTYTRGTVRFHHYITSYVTSGVYGVEEFAIDVDPYNHTYVENSFNGMVTSRVDYSVCYTPLNTYWNAAMATFRTNGEHYFYNAEKLTTNEHTTSHGLKLLVNDTDLRIQNVSGLADCAAILLKTSTDASEPNNVVLYGGGSARVARFATAGAIVFGYVRPSADNSFTCGHPSFKWTVVHAQTGTIATSDERAKLFGTIEDAERAAALEIKANLRKYKLLSSIEEKGKDGARWHFGAAAQQVGDIMRSHGLDPHDYGFFCYDEWEAEEEKWDEWPDQYAKVPAVLDGDGNEIEPAYEILVQPAGRKLAEPAIAAGNSYGIRYDELLCFIMAAI